jgi:hypothetical protein
MARLLFITSLHLFLATHLHGQEAGRSDDDVSSIENITTAILQSISGDAGEKRNWNRFRNLFHPLAQISAIFHKGDSAWIKIHTINEFISHAGTWYEENGFREYKYKSKVEEFGNIAQVFQSYGAALADGKEIERGINSYQLAFIDNRWWIISLMWDSETAKQKLTRDLLED